MGACCRILPGSGPAPRDPRGGVVALPLAGWPATAIQFFSRAGAGRHPPPPSARRSESEVARARRWGVVDPTIGGLPRRHSGCSPAWSWACSWSSRRSPRRASPTWSSPEAPPRSSTSRSTRCCCGALPCCTPTCASAAALRPLAGGSRPPSGPPGAAYAALRVAMEPEARADDGWLDVAEVVVAAMLTAMLAASGRIRLAVNPLLLGLSLASLVTTGRLLLLRLGGALAGGARVACGPAGGGAGVVRRQQLAAAPAGPAARVGRGAPRPGHGGPRHRPRADLSRAAGRLAQPSSRSSWTCGAGSCSVSPRCGWSAPPWTTSTRSTSRSGTSRHSCARTGP